MTGSQIIVLATPVFLLLIALEYAVGHARGRNTYRLNDALASLGLGVLSQVTAVYGGLLRLGIYVFCYEHLALTSWPADAVWTWAVALVFYDFCYYWFHRASHRVAVLWAAHVVHHQSEDYNLSTALRQPSTSFLLGWIFYLPMALAGVPPLVFAGVALIDLLYQYWVHTQQVGRLGWFDRWFCSPSNHRVHHAVNECYLDRNHGGILMIWDRLFGTFVEEDDAVPVVYGTRSPLRSFDPLWANLQVYRDLVQDAWHAAAWADKLRVWLRPPGWRPADVQRSAILARPLTSASLSALTRPCRRLPHAGASACLPRSWVQPASSCGLRTCCGRPKRPWPHWSSSACCGSSAASSRRPPRRGLLEPPDERPTGTGPAGRGLHLRQQGRRHAALHRGARCDVDRGRG